jgi:hypothetical protein
MPLMVLWLLRLPPREERSFMTADGKELPAYQLSVRCLSENKKGALRSGAVLVHPTAHSQ